MSDTSNGDSSVKQQNIDASDLPRQKRSLDPRAPQSRQTNSVATVSATTDEPKRELSAAAKRALDEAETRRSARSEKSKAVTEINGRKGPDPTRYGDWEKDGIISDF